ncbi:MAG: hypothetical protein ACOX6F_06950 [Syntrophomonadaceae bacterium]|jgi:hypothetical protein|nr:hypothetical protein [Syntrophomonadaceae bacterium]HAA09670.1 hypothetical protein [Syntrophomonas sp.]HQA50961.1 hypothetical protein [Syntrophomonadaceae bacterium]HQD90568.1 hypothetical protein [Syntrophomonadaceae bacterium]
MQLETPKGPERLNCYLPIRNSEANPLEDLIQTLTESLIQRLEDLCGSEILDRLASIPDPELQQETMLLREEIQKLKDRLYQM